KPSSVGTTVYPGKGLRALYQGNDFNLKKSGQSIGMRLKCSFQRPARANQATSKRSLSMTLAHAATKSFANFSPESEHAYTSARARSCECEPKIRSTRVPVHLTLFVFRSRPSYTPSEPADGCHCVLMSSRLTKKSFVSVSGRLVKTPRVDFPGFAPSTRRPPTRTVISGAVSVSNWARSTNSSSADK